MYLKNRAGLDTTGMRAPIDFAKKIKKMGTQMGVLAAVIRECAREGS